MKRAHTSEVVAVDSADRDVAELDVVATPKWDPVDEYARTDARPDGDVGHRPVAAASAESVFRNSRCFDIGLDCNWHLDRIA